MPPGLVIFGMAIGWIGASLQIALMLEETRTGMWSPAMAFGGALVIVVAEIVSTVGLWRMSRSGVMAQVAILAGLPLLVEIVGSTFLAGPIMRNLPLIAATGAPWLPLGLFFGCTIPLWSKMTWRFP